jgi:hypothetical protein
MFDKIAYEIHYRSTIAWVYTTDPKCVIFLGNPFWDNKTSEIYSREAALIHEVSHFKSIGNTFDHKYDIECEDLTKSKPELALYNADSYAFFITGDK